MSHSFSRLAKKDEFSNKTECLAETDRLLTVGEFNKDYPAVATLVIDSIKDMKVHIYPRIEHFHKNKREYSNKVSKGNIFAQHRNLFQRASIFSTTHQATYDTLEYVLDEFHKCIFVQILDNKIYTFVMINRYDTKYSKMLKDTLKFDPSKYKNMNDFINQTQRTLFKNFRVLKRKEDSIYFTDCALHLWNIKKSEHEIDRIYIYFYNILKHLLRNRSINDCEFIFNSRDLNMLMNDGISSPHYNLYGTYAMPLKKKYKSYMPILNFNKHKKFADIPVPTNDDWEIITNKMFLGTCRDIYLNVKDKLNTDYDSKIPTAIFRGGATGCGVDTNTNPRLKAAYLTQKYYHSKKYGIDNSFDHKLYLDARVVSFKTHPKKNIHNKYVTVIDPTQLRIKLNKKMPLAQISNYKYILSIEGNVAQFRLTLELSYNSVILLVKSDQYIWHQPLLKPWVHYVPVRADLSDLMEKIHWCKTHDSKCKDIASNAVAFYNKYISEDGVYDYMECVFDSFGHV